MGAQTINPADQGMVFDAAPVSTATTAPAPPPSSGDSGMVFDATPTTKALSVPAQPTKPDGMWVGKGGAITPVPAQPKDVWAGWSPSANDSISATPQPTGVADKVERWSRNLAEDLKYGTDLTGIGTVLKKMGAHGVYAENPEAVGDFMASLPLGLVKATTGGAELGQQGKRWQGTKDVVSGVAQAATLPGSVVAPEAAELGATGLDAVGTQASRAAKAVGNAISKPFDVDSVQKPLQDGIRSIFDAVEKQAGVASKPATSIRDVATNLSDAVEAKGSALYKQLDAATGGKFQRFADSAKDVRDELSNVIEDVEPGLHKTLTEKAAKIEAAAQKAFTAARNAGVEPTLINDANAAWRQQNGLGELGNAIRKAAGGMRPELSNAKSSLETLSPTKLFSRLNTLYDKGRLVDAVGPENAKALLQHVDSAYLAASKIANRNALIGRAARAVGLTGAAAGGVGELHHLFSGSD